MRRARAVFSLDGCRVDEERPHEVLRLPDERVFVDKERLERGEAAQPRRKHPETVPPQRQRVEPRELRERLGQAREIAIVGEEDVEAGKGAEERG